MKPFRFSLDKVLKVRQTEAKLAKNALAQARLRSRQALVLFTQAEQERAASEQALLARRLQRMTALQWALANEQHEARLSWEQQAQTTLTAALAEEERRRLLLAEAERREKVLDKLRERKFDEYRYAAESHEQSVLDEMARNITREGGGRR